MNIEIEIKEIFSNNIFFSKIGCEIDYEIKYSFKYLKGLEQIPLITDKTKYINSENEFLNILRGIILKKIGQDGLKKLNLMVVDIKNEFKRYNYFFEKYDCDLVLVLKSHIINMFIEKFVNLYCNESFNFFSDTFRIFEKGNIVVGFYFRKKNFGKIYNIFTYVGDSINSEAISYSDKDIVLMVF